MANEEQESWWIDKVILLPKGLLTADVTGEELAVYAKMKGFGAEVRCGLEALSTRLGWEVKKVRRHQNELWKKGWIFLMREGANRKPRFWFLATKPFEYPPVEKFQELGITDVPTQPWQGADNGQGDEKAPPANPAPESYKALQAAKESSIKREKAITPLQQEANTLEAIYKAAWEGRYTRSQYLAVPADQKRFLAWAKAHIKPDAFSAKVARLMEREEPWALQHRHSTWLLESDWNKLETEELAPREACKHPLDRMKDVKDYGPQIYGTCGVCGHKGYHMKESE
jgi:hypothetical protein